MALFQDELAKDSISFLVLIFNLAFINVKTLTNDHIFFIFNF
jgi:hypothetical protein